MAVHTAIFLLHFIWYTPTGTLVNFFAILHQFLFRMFHKDLKLLCTEDLGITVKIPVPLDPDRHHLGRRHGRQFFAIRQTLIQRLQYVGLFIYISLAPQFLQDSLPALFVRLRLPWDLRLFHCIIKHGRRFCLLAAFLIHDLHGCRHIRKELDLQTVVYFSQI